MIQEISNLTSLQFPGDDVWLKTYLEKINKVGYQKRILEKDFYLTALLGWISKNIPDVSFKGGTCLNKIHFPYFRLSEDLDFSRPIGDHGRSALRHFAHDMDDKMLFIADTLGRTLSKRHGSVSSNIHLEGLRHTYLKYEFSYISIFGSPDTIKVELTYTNKQYIPSVYLPIQHIYHDLVFGQPYFPETMLQSISLDEMIAEKTRAALTRHVPVIRDFFDLRYLTSKGHTIADHIDLIRIKCAESNNNWSIDTFQHPMDTTKRIETLSYLQTKIDSDLKPVVPNGFAFDLHDIYTEIKKIHSLLLS